MPKLTQAQLDQAEAEAAHNASGSNFYSFKNRTEDNCRLLPLKIIGKDKNGEPVYEYLGIKVVSYFIEGKSYPCPQDTKGMPSVLHEVSKILAKLGTPEADEWFNALKSNKRTRFLLKVISRSNPMLPVVMEAPIAVYEELMRFQKVEQECIWHPDDGFDWRWSKEGSGKKTDYICRVARNPSHLMDSREEEDALMKLADDIDREGGIRYDEEGARAILKEKMPSSLWRIVEDELEKKIQRTVGKDDRDRGSDRRDDRRDDRGSDRRDDRRDDRGSDRRDDRDRDRPARDDRDERRPARDDRPARDERDDRRSARDDRDERRPARDDRDRDRDRPARDDRGSDRTERRRDDDKDDARPGDDGDDRRDPPREERRGRDDRRDDPADDRAADRGRDRDVDADADRREADRPARDDRGDEKDEDRPRAPRNSRNYQVEDDDKKDPTPKDKKEEKDPPARDRKDDKDPPPKDKKEEKKDPPAEERRASGRAGGTATTEKDDDKPRRRR